MGESEDDFRERIDEVEAAVLETTMDDEVPFHGRWTVDPLPG